LKDPTLAEVFQKLLSDQSYKVIRAAAVGLGQTKSPGAYDSLVKLLNVPSWRDNVRTAGLVGLAALGDKRAVEAGLKYAERGNYPQLRTAAVTLIGVLGKSDPRAFETLSRTLEGAYGQADSFFVAATSEAIAHLGDERGLALFERLAKSGNAPTQQTRTLARYQEQLRKEIAGAQKPASTTP
jgi:HEAT repeat protein